jgi:hypothetical protein
MVEPIFHNEKKYCVGNKKNLETEQNDLYQSTVFYEERYNIFIIWFSFSVNKKKKNTKLNSPPT